MAARRRCPDFAAGGGPPAPWRSGPTSPEGLPSSSPSEEWAGAMTTEREGRGGVSRRDWGSGCKIPAQTLSLRGGDILGDKGDPNC